MKTRRLPLLSRCLVATLAYTLLSLASASAQSKAPLRNADFLQGDGEQVTAWEFSTFNLKNDSSQQDLFEWGSEDAGGTKALFFATKESIRGNMWWQQILTASPGESYKLKVAIKGALEAGKYARPSVGVYFLGENNKWLGYQEISGLDFSSADEWKTVEETVTAPEDAVKMGVRLGAMFDGAIHVAFKDLELTTGN